MDKTDFSVEEKICLFDMIADRYFNRNFGTMLKADIDCLIFSSYIEHCLDSGSPSDDFTLSIQLGISEARVRSLKERKQLQYPRKDYNWKEEFVKLIPSAKYNDSKNLVQMNIGDVNLLKEVRNFVYSNGWFDEFQMNPKLFQCKLEFFISMCSKLEDEVVFTDDQKTNIKKLSQNEKDMMAIEKIINGDYENGFRDLIKYASNEVLDEALKCIPFGGLAKDAVRGLLRVITK